MGITTQSFIASIYFVQLLIKLSGWQEIFFLVWPSCSTLNLPFTAHPNRLTCLQGWHPSLTDQFSEPLKLQEDQPRTLVAASQNLPGIICKTEQLKYMCINTNRTFWHYTTPLHLKALTKKFFGKLAIRRKRAHGNILSFYLISSFVIFIEMFPG